MKWCFFIFILISGVVGSAQTITQLSFEGNEKIKDNFLRKIVKVTVNEMLDSTLIEADINRLKRLPAISNATYKIEKVSENEYKVTYTLEENFTIIPSANVYTTNNDEFAFRVGLYEFNGFGSNIGFGGYFQKDIYYSYGLNFNAPYLFSNKMGIALNFQDLTTQEPVFFDNTTADYKYNNLSVEVLGLYEFNFKNRIAAGLNVFSEKYDFIRGATNIDVAQNLDVNKLSYKLKYEYNDVSYFFYFLDGFKNLLNFQYVTSTEESLPQFSIVYNDFIYYKRFGEKGNWANRLRLGLATNNNSPFAPFAVDNNLNIRGVGNSIDRGTAAIVLNTEYRYTLYEKDWFVLQGNAFIDAGTWRNPGGDFGDFSKKQNVRVYPGLGLRFIHKRIYNAVFRIDYGYGITDQASNGLVFGIGQYF